MQQLKIAVLHKKLGQSVHLRGSRMNVTGVNTAGNVFRKFWVLDQKQKNKQATPEANLGEYLEKGIGILGCTVQLCYGYYLVLGGLGNLVITQTNKLPEVLIIIQIRLRF